MFEGSRLLHAQGLGLSAVGGDLNEHETSAQGVTYTDGYAGISRARGVQQAEEFTHTASTQRLCVGHPQDRFLPVADGLAAAYARPMHPLPPTHRHQQRRGRRDPRHAARAERHPPRRQGRPLQARQVAEARPGPRRGGAGRPPAIPARDLYWIGTSEAAGILGVTGKPGRVPFVAWWPRAVEAPVDSTLDWCQPDLNPYKSSRDPWQRNVSKCWLRLKKQLVNAMHVSSNGSNEK